MEEATYRVRVYSIEKRKNAKGKTVSHRVLWKVGETLFKESFKNAAQADSFRSGLLSASREGEAFSERTGLPVSRKRITKRMRWFDFCVAFVDHKWKDASAKHRADIARVLMLATFPLLSSERGKPEDLEIRRALSRWAFNTKHRDDAPDSMKTVMRWVQSNTLYVDALLDEGVLLRVLDAITTKQDGRRMAAVTVKKYRGILHGALKHAVVLKALTENPLADFEWIDVRTSREVDRRSVLNPRQGRRLLEEVENDGPSGRRLVALFGSMLYCGLRPEEAVEVADHNLVLPALVWSEEKRQWLVWTEDEGEWIEASEDASWGEIYVGPVSPEVAREWTDDGSRRDSRDRPKHRAEGETRGPIPVPPVQVRLFLRHISEFGTAPDGRLFRGVKADRVPGETIRRVFKRARSRALTPDERDSPLARRPYDLRHTCLSLQLSTGVTPRQVADWAGNSVKVLLEVYAKCITGQTHIARQRIAEAFRE